MMGLIPYVIAEIAWDYADSCVNIAAIHKLSEYKTVCRRIRELRTVYERHHSQFTVNNQRAFETENMIKFQEDYADFFERLHSNIKHEITTNTQTTDKDCVMLEVCAYSCIVAIKAMRNYIVAIEDKVTKMLGRSLGGTLMTREMIELNRAAISLLSKQELPAFINSFSSALSEYLLQTEIINTEKQSA